MWQGQGFGQGQNWFDVTAFRALGTLYSNSTSKPISIFTSYTCGASWASTLIAYVINPGASTGSLVGAGSNAGSGGGACFITFTVQSGASYWLTQNSIQPAILSTWSELR